GYRGGDNFYIREGKFIREFPIYDSSDKDAKPTAAKRVLQYGLRGNEFTVKQLSTDSADNKTTSVTQSQPAKAASVKKQASSKKSQQRNTEKKHKKKRRHHSS
ncbi:MAG: hypothetical protein JST32_13290, partial [Bacteroidetes bacterium]|nr:hypothetical protein [Bacteroidota bacterium]